MVERVIGNLRCNQEHLSICIAGAAPPHPPYRPGGCAPPTPRACCARPAFHCSTTPKPVGSSTCAAELIAARPARERHFATEQQCACIAAKVMQQQSLPDICTPQRRPSWCVCNATNITRGGFAAPLYLGGPARFAHCHLPISRLCSGFFNRRSAKPLLVLIGSSRYGALAATMSNRHQPICEPVKTLIPIKSRRAKRENDNLPISDT